MLLPGRQAFTNFMDQQAFMIDWTGRAAHEEGSSIQVHAQSHQLKRNFAEVTRLTHPLGETWAVALGNQLWLSQQFYFDTHQSANKRQEFASPSKNESSDARNGAQECAPTIVQLTTSSTPGSQFACQLGRKAILMQCSLIGESENIIMRTRPAIKLPYFDLLLACM